MQFPRNRRQGQFQAVRGFYRPEGFPRYAGASRV
jgi:hypothetical protein